MKAEEKILNPYITRRLDVADVLHSRLTMANHFEYEVPFPNQLKELIPIDRL